MNSPVLTRGLFNRASVLNNQSYLEPDESDPKPQIGPPFNKYFNIILVDISTSAKQVFLGH
jgi:hypothetical protein